MRETKHQGRAIKRLREILHVKQDNIALALNISQQSVSVLETKETLEPEILEKIAKELGVPVEVIKNFDEEATIYNIQSYNTFEGNEGVVGVTNHNFSINPLEKWLESMEEIKRLNAALLKEKDEKIALLERFLTEKK